MNQQNQDPHGQLVAAIQKHSDLSKEEIIEAGQYGADAGWSGFIWNDEAAAFFEANETLIWELLASMAEECGYKNPLDLVATFRRSDMLETPQGFKVLLAWFALEEAGRYLEIQRESDISLSRMNQQKPR